ncbi:MAG: histidine kinase dimerization/phospho-acceptor domain-containing protein [Chloroflexota bacterium]
MNQSLSLNEQQPAISVPLSEIREQIEAIHYQLVHPKPSSKELLDSLQHDLRTPVGNILACVTLLNMEGELTESQSELVSIVEDAAKALINKLDHVRKLSI